MKKALFTFAFLTILLIMFSASLVAQVTTSAMTGIVTTESGERLPGATVLAIHEPSGTQYGTITNIDGIYDLQGMRSGGPYKVEISFVGYSKETYTDIRLFLGETFVLNATLTESAVDVGEVMIVGTKASNVSTRLKPGQPPIFRMNK